MRSDLVAGGAQAPAVQTPGAHGAGVLILKGEIDEGFPVQTTFAGTGVSPLSRSHVMVPLLHDVPLLRDGPLERALQALPGSSPAAPTGSECV